MKILRKHTERYLVHLLDNLKSFSFPEGVHPKWLSESEKKRLHEVWPVNLGQLNERWQRGDFCLVGEGQEGLTNYLWIQTGGRHFLQPNGLWIDLEIGQAVIYHVRVKKEFQSQGIGSAAYSWALAFLTKSGFQLAWIYTNAQNKANLSSLGKLGFQHWMDLETTFFLQSPIRQKKQVNPVIEPFNKPFKI